MLSICLIIAAMTILCAALSKSSNWSRKYAISLLISILITKIALMICAKNPGKIGLKVGIGQKKNGIFYALLHFWLVSKALHTCQYPDISYS